MKTKKILFKLLTFILTTSFLLNVMVVSIIGNTDNSSSINITKINTNLRNILETSKDDEEILVWIWLNEINTDEINQKVFKETGMNPYIYENKAEFDKEVKPSIVQNVTFLYESKKYSNFELKNINVIEEIKNADLNNIIDEAISAEYNKYWSQKRSIVKREYSKYNVDFIQKNILSNAEEKVIYCGSSTSTIICSLKKKEIAHISFSNDVDEISLYKETNFTKTGRISMEQVGIYCDNGTGYDNTYNDGLPAYNGIGVKIGVLESVGKYDSSAPLLVNKTNLYYIDNIDSNGNIDQNANIVDLHATDIVSLIGGKIVQRAGKIYSGVVPGATIYQTSFSTEPFLYSGLQNLIDQGVCVINCSFAALENIGEYTYTDKEIDKIAKNNSITIVTATGNMGLSVQSPGKSLNSISVGGADSIDENGIPKQTPYEIWNYSSYIESSYSPNKPDIVAPSVNVPILYNFGVSLENGTSLAAPIITGIVAQMIDADSSLVGNPTKIKALLLLGADSSKISTTNNQLIDSVRDKSGAGFANAINAVTNVFDATTYTSTLSSHYGTATHYLEAGQTIRAILVFNKNNEKNIQSSADLDDLDLYLYKYNGALIETAESSKNNVEFIEYTATSSGYYYFRIMVNHIADENAPPTATIAFTISD